MNYCEKMENKIKIIDENRELNEWLKDDRSQNIFPSEYALKSNLGLDYSKERSIFRVWAPSREYMTLNLYASSESFSSRRFKMYKKEDVFEIALAGDLSGFYYTYSCDGREVTDPYSVACSINSQRSFIADLKRSDPEDFRLTSYVKTQAEDSIIYELHVGDFTFSKSSNVKERGKYLGLIQEGTNLSGLATGIDHLKDLGISHVHLMPVYDFISVDEESEHFGRKNNYNWGYDPELYNIPEGAYSSDPENPYSRVRELKELIKTFHKNGIGVIIDVVYNHTFKTYDSNFNILVPGYYYRSENGIFSNGSGCGNEFATERSMARKFIIDSLLYWQREYMVDGFRFDLMALIDRGTIELAVKKLREVNPYTIIYGEPWTGARSSLDISMQTLWSYSGKSDFALFNESYRNAIRGDNDGDGRGFIQGITSQRSQIIEGIMGSINSSILGKRKSVETINYFSAHDNLILEDKLTKSVGDSKRNDSMSRLAFGLLLTSEGIPFIHEGTEFRRSKFMLANSYNASYDINAIDWNLKRKNKDFYYYVRALIEIRKEYPIFHLKEKEEIEERVKFIDFKHPNLISMLYKLEDANNYLLIFHYNGWNGSSVPMKPIFEELDCFKFRLQKIFDHNGKIYTNACDHLMTENNYVNLREISTSIYKISVQSEID